MKIFNRELELFINFLFNLKLIDQKSRMRSRLVNLLNDKFKLFKDEHFQLIKEHSYLDDQGNPKITDNQYDIIDLATFNLAFNELSNEEVIIEQNDERKKMLESVRDSVLNCGLEFAGQEYLVYDRWCDIVEEINYESEGEN